MTGPDGDARIAALFRDAAADAGAPPPGFDHDTVVARSRRVTARRRSAVVGGALALLVVTGVGVATGLPGSPGAETSAAAPARGSAEAPPAAAPEDAPDAGPDAASPQPYTAPGSAESGSAADESAPALAQGTPAVPLGPGATECAQVQDPRLRALLEEALPEAAGASEAAVSTECRPGGERAVSLELGGGVLTVRYLPPGSPAVAAEGAEVRPTASGGTVLVSARGSGPGVASPFADRLVDVADRLAPLL